MADAEVKITVDSTRLTWAEVFDRVRALPIPHKGCGVWGVPRGGAIVAGLMATMRDLGPCIPVDSPDMADVIVDDVIDSGDTERTFTERFPRTPFLALVDGRTRADLGWVVFPWEEEPDVDVSANVTRLLQAIGEDPNRDGLRGTPARVVKALREMTAGSLVDTGALLARTFAQPFDEMIVVRRVPFVSLCEHHLMPFTGHATVGYLPSDGRVVGLSKIARLVDAHARRLQIQERFTQGIASDLEHHLRPLGCGVVVEAVHACMSARGARVEAPLVTSCLRGAFRSEPKVRAEFLELARP